MLLETPKKEDGDGKDLQNLRALADLPTDVNRLPEDLRPGALFRQTTVTTPNLLASSPPAGVGITKN